MLTNIYLITAITVSLFSLSAMTITGFLFVNKLFQEYLERIIKEQIQKSKD